MNSSALTHLTAAIVFAVVLSASAPAQDRIGPHEWQEQQAGTLSSTAINKHLHPKAADGTLSRIVYGYHPYWRPDASIDNYRSELLSHVAYFSYAVDPATGGYSTVRDWLTTPLVDWAKARGVKVHLCVTNFGSGNNRALLSSQPARDTLIANLVRMVQARGADGVNIDFESVPGSERENMVTFFADLRTRLQAAVPGAEIAVAAPAVDWSGSWDLERLKDYIDIFFVMCYDYYWSGASTAGPVAPIQGSTYNVTRTLEYYLNEGVPRGQIVMGVPYYGIDWPVVSDAENSPATGTGRAFTYAGVKSSFANETELWSERYLNPWFSYRPTDWRQCWYDNATSLELKYDLSLDLDIGGVGMWALSYDDGHTELWDLLERKFFIPTGVKAASNATALSLHVYPQPVDEGQSISVRLQGVSRSQGTSLRIVDGLGRTVRRLDVPDSGELEIPGLPAGMYIALLQAGRERIAARFIVL